MLIRLTEPVQNVVFTEIVPVPAQYGLRVNAVTVRCNGTLQKRQEDYVFQGSLRAELPCSCDLCLEPFVALLDVDFSETFHRTDSKENEMMGFLQSEDAEVWFFSGNEADLSPVVESILLLNMPLRFICGDSCKGLCQFCGQNLNEESCGCDSESADPRFDSLKTLFHDQENQKT